MPLNKSILSIPPEDFKYLLKYSRRSNKIGAIECKDLIYLPYWDVKVELPVLVNEADFEGMIKLMRKYNHSSLWGKLKPSKITVQKAIPFICWVRDSIEQILTLEREYLTSQPDADLMNAGIETLNELGDLNVIDMLANGSILEWEKVKLLPYHQVFDKLRKNKLEGDIQKKLQKIQQSKAKRR